MNERSMTKLSLFCSLTGLAVIYAAAMQVRPTMTPIASLDNEFVGLQVAISGQVVDSRAHRDGHLFLKLRDDSGSTVNVPVFARVRSELGEPIELLDVVQVTGEVGLFRGELQVVPQRASDLRVVHTAPVKLSSLSRENAGMPVKVQGTVVEREIVGSGGLILTMREDGGHLTVFVPRWVVEDGLPELHVGNVVRVDGWLQLYNGELELKIRCASYLRVVEAA
jgi:DNA/RNA endonuclease YhcR with UshA esterase domain